MAKTYLVTVDDNGKETRQEVTAKVAPKGTTLVVAPVGGYWDAATAVAVRELFAAGGVTATVIAAPITVESAE